ncbi:MAG: CoA transferase [Chloroflexi bacterium]|nr:CoA transferase [Chloroflexota bacterium]
MTFALEDIKVLDMTRLAPGPYCTMILGDLGADVIKIEEPGGGRRAVMERASLGPPPLEKELREAAFDAHSRNKRSLVLNLKSEEARGILYKLVERSDVFLEGFRPGVAARLGADYGALSSINPRLVYCSLSGFGQDGPYRLLVGHDINYISIAGALGMIGPRSGKPSIPGNLLADYAGGGMHAALGIMAALLARVKTGKGQYVDISMTDGVLSLLTHEATRYFYTGVVPKPSETRFNGALPYYNVYETKDGKYVSIGCNEPWFWENLCKAIGHEELGSKQFAKDQETEEVFATLSQAFKTRTRDEWIKAFKDSGLDIAGAPVYSFDEVFEDPQVRHRQMLAEIDHPALGKVKQMGISIKLSETPGKIRSVGPVRGQHTEEILRELGESPEEIEQLRKAGAIE